ncbi:MAG: hypothetical protein J5601_04255 [Elusimicrobiaceae bacterium]|nr:hypothetical protein [Elusimicrobiaceae bacterium]
MIQIITAIKDKKAETFNFSNTAVTTGTAVRDLMRYLNNGQKNDLNQFPEDFELWQLGTIDTSSGEIAPKLKKIIELKNLVDNTKSKPTNENAK